MIDRGETVRQSSVPWVLVGALWCSPALAHEVQASGRIALDKVIARHERPFGREGDPRKVSRTVRIDISDAMRFFPHEIRVKSGQTVRFIVRNTGEHSHQFVLGTHEGLKVAAARMRRAPDAGKPLGLQLRPGQTTRLVWQFTRAGEFHYACLMPGHFEAGAVGTIIVR
jgi:uncharacterized cupredoxin-like copper-binding protein